MTRTTMPTATPPPAAQVVFTLIYPKAPNEYYIFMYSPENRDNLIQSFGRMAANAELSFTWADAAALAARVRGNKPDWKIDE